MLVEVWCGDINLKHPSVLVKSKWVINGEYAIDPDKENNKIYIPATKETYDLYYAGDVEYTGNYNETLNNYKDTKKVLGKNLIKELPAPKEQEYDEDTIPF